MRIISALFFMFIFTVYAGEDAVSKPLADRDAAVAKAKDVFDKAEQAANAKLLADLKSALKRTGVDKVAIAVEIAKLNPNDAEALEVMNKEGKLADLGRAAAKEVKGRAVYKVWNDKGRLDYVGCGTIDTLTSDGGRRLNHKHGTVKSYIEITTPGEYKVQAWVSEGRLSTTFMGKKVDWSRPAILPLPKGKFPLLIELEGAKDWTIKFVPKAESSLSVLGEPYLLTDPIALKEVEADPKFEAQK